MTVFPCASYFSRRRLLAAGGAFVGAALLPGMARADEAWQTAFLPQARQRDLLSAATGQRYRIFLSVPDTPAPAAGHPVLYALDGNASFPLLALMARTAARRSKASGLAAPVVVGIGYAAGEDYDMAARTRDYTPPWPGAPLAEGGADRFLDFIEQELKPLVRSLVAVDPHRQALYGHSYGGLCTLHALFTRPAMFQAWLAASPSIWYRDRLVLNELAGFDKRVAALAMKPSVLLTAGELEQPSGDALQGTRNAALVQRRMVDEARNLAAKLRALDGATERVQFYQLALENHGSAAFPAMSRGMEFFIG
jgi:predicted alpha/beta superfamily hydrolase